MSAGLELTELQVFFNCRFTNILIIGKLLNAGTCVFQNAEEEEAGKIVSIISDRSILVHFFPISLSAASLGRNELGRCQQTGEERNCAGLEEVQIRSTRAADFTQETMEEEEEAMW